MVQVTYDQSKVYPSLNIVNKDLIHFTCCIFGVTRQKQNIGHGAGKRQAEFTVQGRGMMEVEETEKKKETETL